MRADEDAAVQARAQFLGREDALFLLCDQRFLPHVPTRKKDCDVLVGITNRRKGSRWPLRSITREKAHDVHAL